MLVVFLSLLYIWYKFILYHEVHSRWACATLEATTFICQKIKIGMLTQFKLRINYGD